MEITVYAKTLSGNMGEGWVDESAANRAYASFLENKITEEITDRYPDADVTVEIEAENASGYTGEPIIEVTPHNFEIGSDIEEIMPHIMQTAWEAWLNSDESNEYI